MINLTKDNFDKVLAECDDLILVDLWAEWCGPCRMLAPVLDELEDKYENVKFAKINVDEERELAELFHVTSIPMLALVKDNVFLDFSVGFMPMPEVEAFINEHLEK